MSASESVNPKHKRKSKDKGKGKEKATEIRNEGTDPHWAFSPPPGTVLLDSLTDAGDFDYEKLKADDSRSLWLIRVPDNVKPKHLENLKISLPSSSETQHLGTLDRKHVSFDVWSLGGNTDQEDVGGDELKTMSCLVPRQSKKGKLLLAPIPFTRHIILTEKPAISTVDPAIATQNPPRHSYPKEILKHRFMPCGSFHTGQDGDEPTSMAVDPPASPTKSKTHKRKKVEDEEGEVGTPKKHKKHKTAKT